MVSTSSPSSKITIAVTQAEPVWLDLEATVDKTCKLIAEAAKNGAKIITFPEVWIPGYPAWIWYSHPFTQSILAPRRSSSNCARRSRNMDPELTTRYIQNSLKLGSPQAECITQCAAEHGIVVVLGFSENVHESLYMSQAVIDADGQVRVTRSKMKPTHMERTIFGDSRGDCLAGVADTAAGRVGALNCWEHLQPLLKYHMYAQREQIHVASWPPVHADVPEGCLESMSGRGIAAIAQVYAMESQSFVLHTTSVIGPSGIELMSLPRGALMSTPGGGNSCVFGPDGKKLTTDIPEHEEGIVYATIDLNDILKARAFIDVCGHYSRPDLLWLGADKDIKRHVRDL
ncbi:Nitrilase/cyanide hydratase and apolipoprotein N-acyltransferase [Cordyceps fumosorosea ARSEF 2679]|uniref:nitrilase n=1 Tax=Cordyceps fumosorosea (strain ARSEF 2679) TaxID=1081104 RepID=A0A167R1J2_CORFA|nr:Nitrilase/cyanide hydratase and apolipoprotein N-acyltransferase [Cordyceps fumosorosea ARSEF 2679]OAA58183.1 Nitrilase/cyanide hydratase and apolipoprotein N-acyltransferase [Cordyceps fumosorosea ARSEF 2679]